MEPLMPSTFKPTHTIEHHEIGDIVGISPKANYMQGAPVPMGVTSNFGSLS